ncbi:MAG: hypothetical protein LAP87_04875 [Acidobacteriia bacterium]|nr:hypothetical protein [Terriglobia bacterium]
MTFKTGLVSYLFGLMDHLALHKIVEGAIFAAPAMTAAAGAGEAGSWVYPAALLAAPLVKPAEDYFEKKKQPEELADLYRESLLHALETCTRNNHGLTLEDHGIVELWEEGLAKNICNFDCPNHTHPRASRGISLL